MSEPDPSQTIISNSVYPTNRSMALVLAGGGARAAYQAGVLSAIARMYPEWRFPFLTGVSAGAINISLLANHPGALREQAETLVGLWRNLRIENVFTTNGMSLISRAVRIGIQLGIGMPKFLSSLHGMVDTSPLREFLYKALGSTDGSLPGIQRNIAAGNLETVALTAISYGTLNTVTFFQGQYNLPSDRFRRCRSEIPLTVEHVMASAALPLFFPPIQIGGEWYGDGGVRLANPLTPALNTGAHRIMAISNHYLGAETQAVPVHLPPSPATVMAALYNAVFLDQLDEDVLQMEMINQLVRELPDEQRHGMREIKLLVIRPSKDIGAMAYRLRHNLPNTLNFMMSRFGTDEIRSQDFLSTVMFHSSFIEQLIELGQQDGEARADEIHEFFDS